MLILHRVLHKLYKSLVQKHDPLGLGRHVLFNSLAYTKHATIHQKKNKPPTKTKDERESNMKRSSTIKHHL